MDWFGTQRQKGIEIILNWHGRLNTGDLIAAFGISRIHATKDIKKYRTRFPDNLHYDLSARSYIKSTTFKLYLTEGKLEEYISHIGNLDSPKMPTIENLSSPQYTIAKPELIADLLWATSNNFAVKIAYASMSNPQGSPRVIHPHALIDNGFRWHIRGFCENNNEFRDFNLGRIVNKIEILKVSPVHTRPNNDTQWNTFVELRLRANPKLSPQQRAIIEIELGMKNNVLQVQSRACLVHYMLQRYQISTDNLDNPDSHQLLAVVKPSDVLQHLFTSS